MRRAMWCAHRSAMRRAAARGQRRATAVTRMIAPARAPRLRVRQREPQATRAARLLRLTPVALAAAEVVAIVIVVVPQPEEPHQPHDEGSDVEDSEAHHEDPS